MRTGSQTLPTDSMWKGKRSTILHIQMLCNFFICFRSYIDPHNSIILNDINEIIYNIICRLLVIVQLCALVSKNIC